MTGFHLASDLSLAIREANKSPGPPREQCCPRLAVRFKSPWNISLQSGPVAPQSTNPHINKYLQLISRAASWVNVFSPQILRYYFYKKKTKIKICFDDSF